jgi:hypothetical protein
VADKEKITLIQPNRSAEFFCANLREPFFYADLRRKKTLMVQSAAAGRLIFAN